METVTKKEFAALEKRVAKLEGADSSNQDLRRPKSIREFILEKEAKSETDKAVCLMSFLEEVEKVEEGISSSDLTEAFKKAREKMPVNVSEVLAKCAKKSWIDQVGKDGRKKKWRLTNTGIKYVKEL